MNHSTELPTILLLHGAGTGAWVWERVVPDLSAPALALDVPSRSEGATPDSCTDALVRDLNDRQVGSVLVVLHSLAGVLAGPLASRLGSRLRHVVFVGAVIPRSGGSFVDELPFPNRLILKTLFFFNRSGLKPSAGMIRRELCNDLSNAEAERVVARYEPEWRGLYLTPASTSRVPSGAAYVKLLKDKTLPVNQQDRAISQISSPRIHELATGHLPMLGAPEELANILNRETEFSLTGAVKLTGS